MKRFNVFIIALCLSLPIFFGADANAQQKKVTVLTSKDFAEKVYDLSKDNPEYLGSRPAIIDFYASWCGPCRAISPILDGLAAEYGDRIVIYKVDVDASPEIAREFGIRSIPAVLFIPLGGEPVMTVGGRGKDEFKRQIDTILLGKEDSGK